MEQPVDLVNGDIPLGRDIFLRKLLRELTGTLEEVVGLDEAAGFVSLVGQRIAEWLDVEYRKALGVDRISAEQLPDVLVDLKRRILGEFYLIGRDTDKIVLGNFTCPFSKQVEGRPSLCMMTSAIFGTIAAENLGYAKVELQETIARGDNGCRVTVYLKETAESERAAGIEYYRV